MLIDSVNAQRKWDTVEQTNYCAAGGIWLGRKKPLCETGGKDQGFSPFNVADEGWGFSYRMAWLSVQSGVVLSGAERWCSLCGGSGGGRCCSGGGRMNGWKMRATVQSRSDGLIWYLSDGDDGKDGKTRTLGRKQRGLVGSALHSVQRTVQDRQDRTGRGNDSTAMR